MSVTSEPETMGLLSQLMSIASPQLWLEGVVVLFRIGRLA